jgi:hypothetical protein
VNGAAATPAVVAQILQDTNLAGYRVGDDKVKSVVSGRIDRLHIGDTQAHGEYQGWEKGLKLSSGRGGTALISGVENKERAIAGVLDHKVV